MAGKPVGTIFIELDLDETKYTQKQKQIIKMAEQGSADIEKNYKTLGIKSRQMYEAEVQAATNAHRSITNSAITSVNERRRAEEAYNARLKQLHAEQYGAHVSLTEKIKQNWLAVGAAMAAAYAAIRIGKEMLDASLAMERITSAMQATAGTSRAAARELQFVREESQRLGLSFQDTALAYTKFAASAKGTSAEGEQARKIFSQMSEGITALKLTTDEANGVFYALGQMLSKGKVQAEELRGQLGERLPGAFNLAARAMGVTTAELDKMMKDGHLMAADLLPKLAQEIHNTYGKAATEAAQQGQAAINRFNNEMFDLKARLGDDIKPLILDIAKFLVNYLIPAVKDVIYVAKLGVNELAALIDKGLTMAKYYKTLHGMALGAVFDTDNFKAMKKELAEIDAVLAQRNKQARESSFPKGVSFQKSSAEIAAEGARNAQRAAAEAAGARADADKKAADEAERLAEQFQKAVNSITDNIARLQAEASGISEFRVELEKNRIEYEKYVRDIDEKFTPAQRAQLTAWAEQELRLKDQAAAIKETDRQRKLAVDGIKTETDATLKQLQANQGIATSFVHLSDTLDPITGSYKQYDKQIKEVAAAQKLLNDAMSGDVKAKQVVNEQQITQDQINRTKALVEAQRELYNATNAADFYDQIAGMEEEALSKKLAAIEAERQAKLTLYTDEQDRIAANTLAAQKAAKARAEAFSAKTEPYMQMLGGVADALTGISKLYGEGSNEARKFADAAEALIIAQKALAVVNAVAAVASSATAPWPVQWANMAAMLASMGSLLGSIGESINGGGSSSSSSTPAFWESNSTVLGGDAGEASKSVQNALGILNEVDAESYIELQGIHRQVKNLNDNITGLVRGILQSGATGGLGSLVNGAGVGSSGSSWMNSILGGGTAGLGVAGIGAYMFASILGPIGAAAALLTPTLASLTEGIPIIGDIFGMLDGLLSRIGSFFGSSSTKVTGYGVGIDSAAVIDIINSMGDAIDAYYWVTVQTKKKTFGHVSRKSSTSTQGMTDIEENPWEMLFYSLSSSLVEVAGSIGRDSAEEMQRVFEYVFEVPKLDLANKTASEIQEAVQSWFNAIADTAAGDLFGDFLLQFQDMGEGLFETAVRIVADKEIILDALDQMGLAFEGTAEDAIYFAEGLIKLAGDLDTLQGYMTTYIDAFLTDQEKLINTGERLNAILDTYNMTLPATREGYADLVEGLDLTTESGQDAYYALMRLSQAADQYYDYMERRMEDLLSGAIDTEKSSITDQYNEQLEILNKRFEAAKDIVSDLTNVVNALKKAKEAMRLEDQAYLKGMYEWSMAKLGQYAEQAQRGRLPSVDQINKISEYLTTPNNAKYYSSAIDYQRDYWKVYNQFSSIEAEAQKQLSAAERTVQLIQEQIDILKDWYEDELAKLDTLYDALMGIDNSVLTLAQAISQLAAIQASTGNITPGVSDYITNGGTGDPILNLYSMLLNRNPLAPNAAGQTDVAGYNYWKSAYTSGYSLDQIMDWMMESPEYQAIKAARGFAYGGISSGPETGYQATLHGTELIVSPKGGYPARVKDGGNVIEMTEMKKDIKALREDGKKTRKYLDEMRRDMREWNTSGLLTRTS